MTPSLRRLPALVAALLVLGPVALAAPSSSAGRDDRPDEVFSPVQGFRPTGAKVRVRPSSYSANRVDLGRLRSQLAEPSVAADGGAVVELPTPEGGRARFEVRPTQLMEARLAAAHPEISTYAGRSVSTPGATVALDVTPMGLHAAVRGPIGTRTWYVDPAHDLRGTTTVLSYYGASVPPRTRGFVEQEARQIRSAVLAGTPAPKAGGLVTQRIYRLALTSDPTYAAYFGTENVLAEKVTLINRVDQVYNDDLAISLRLVNATDRLNLDTVAKATGANGPCGAHPCFDPPGPDPESQPGQLAFCSAEVLGRNRTVLGQLVGASNYDIGHLALGVNGGGIAFLGVVGGDYKGGGCTGLPTPEGDFYAIDYVAHEMGHQFAGNHTFDGVKRNCSAGNRYGPTSVEPGSGSSVMAYAGICAQDDLQPHTDPYFSQRSQSEITAFTTTRGARWTEVQTVSLTGFDADGDTVTLGYADRSPVTLTRGVNYTPAGIDQAIERLTGRPVSIAQWGYDQLAGPVTAPDDSGFQVIFDKRPTVFTGGGPDLPSLTVEGSTGGVEAQVGETAKGGATDNRGSTLRATPNHAPVVEAPADRRLPLRTPFTLTGSATDADRDPLTYLWEQDDPGSASGGGSALLDPTRVLGPLFRVFGKAAQVTPEGTLESPSPGENAASLTPTRTFPDLDQVLADNTNAATGRCPGSRVDAEGAVTPAARDCYSELLPMSGYLGRPGSEGVMHFRLTARDGYAEGGGVAHDDVTLRLDPNAGPFRVRSQSTATRLQPGSPVRVTWSVNGTERLARSVRIRLSTDGGQSYPDVLAVTDNDGSADVGLPQVRSSDARIMVEAVDNYFFDVNHASITIG